MLKVKEVAARIGVDYRTVLRWIRAGKLKAVRYGHRTVRIEESALAEFEQQRKTRED